MLPEFIYELAPIAYLCGGVLAVLQIDNWVGRLSGCLLLAAAVVILSLRSVYRHQNRSY